MTAIRIRVRTMMLLVAVIALGCMMYRMGELSGRYRAIAMIHEDKEREARRSTEVLLESAKDSKTKWMKIISLFTAKSANDTAEYHAEMKRKYLRAARNPFLPVAPDPPAP